MSARDELDKLRRRKELEARIPVKPPTESVPERGAIMRFGQGVADRADINARKVTKFQYDMLRKAANAVGLDMGDLEEDNILSNKSIRNLEETKDPSGAASVGGVAADLAVTAPLGYLGRGMEALAGAARTPRLLARTLQARPVQAAVEGATGSALLADPERRGDAAGQGAIYGVALERAGAGIGRLAQGLVKQSPEAQALNQVADLHGTEVKLPLSVAASSEGVISPTMKFLYGKVLPNLPGAEGALAKQAQRANTQFREIAMKEAAPGGMGSTQPGYSGGLPLTTNKTAGAGSNMRGSTKDIQDAFEREYADTVKSYAFNQPNPADLAAKIKAKFPNIDDASLNGVVAEFSNLVNRYSKNGVLDGDNLIRVKTRLAHAGREAGDERVGQSFYQAQEFLDDVVRSELSAGGKGQNLIDLQRYEDLAQPWANFQRVQKATARSKDPTGQFTPQELTGAVKKMSGDRELARGTAPMQELATIGEQTVGQKMHSPGWLERAMTMSALGGAGLLGGPAAVGGLWAAGRGAASPAVQDVLMGTNKTQQALTEALRRNPKKARFAGATLRNTLAAEAAEDE